MTEADLIKMDAMVQNTMGKLNDYLLLIPVEDRLSDKVAAVLAVMSALEKAILVRRSALGRVS